MAHKVQPSVGNASSLFGTTGDGSDEQDDFLSGLSSGGAGPTQSGLKVNPFDAIGEEIEISESEEHLFQPQTQSSSQPTGFNATSPSPYQAAVSPPAVTQANPYTSYAPARTPYGQPASNPYRVSSPSAYTSPYAPSPTVSPYGIPVSESSSIGSAKPQEQPRPASAISRKQVDAYDPPMPPPNKLNRARSSHALAHQPVVSPFTTSYSRPTSPFASTHPQIPSMPPPPIRRGSSNYGKPQEAYANYPVSRPPSIPPPPPTQPAWSPSPPPAVQRPASRSSLNRSTLGGPTTQAAYQPGFTTPYQPTSRPPSRLQAEEAPNLRFQPPSPAREAPPKQATQKQTTPYMQQEGFGMSLSAHSASNDCPDHFEQLHQTIWTIVPQETILRATRRKM